MIFFQSLVIALSKNDWRQSLLYIFAPEMTFEDSDVIEIKSDFVFLNAVLFCYRKSSLEKLFRYGK